MKESELVMALICVCLILNSVGDIVQSCSVNKLRAEVEEMSVFDDGDSNAKDRHEEGDEH